MEGDIYLQNLEEEIEKTANYLKKMQFVIFQCKNCSRFVYSKLGDRRIVCAYCRTPISVNYEQVQVINGLIEASQFSRRYTAGEIPQDEFFKNAQNLTDILPPDPTRGIVSKDLIELCKKLGGIPFTHRNKRFRLVLQYLETRRDISDLDVIEKICNEGELPLPRCWVEKGVKHWFAEKLQKLEQDGLIRRDEKTIHFIGDVDELYPQARDITKCKKAITELFYRKKTLKIKDLHKRLKDLGFSSTAIERALTEMNWNGYLILSDSDSYTWNG